MSTTRPLRITLVNDYELVVWGLHTILLPFKDRVEVVTTAADGASRGSVDLVLYDMFSHKADARRNVKELLAEHRARRLVIYTWNMQPELVRASLQSGASAHLDKRLRTGELVDALERINRGERVVTHQADSMAISGEGDWPGREQGLTVRESEIISLITRGLSNQEIADQAFLSINTVKSYIRSSYQKMGVTSRSHAVLWGIDQGFRVAHPTPTSVAGEL